MNPFPGHDRRLKTRIADDLDDEASLEALVSKGGVFGLKADAAREAVRVMAGRVAAEWPAHAKAAGMKPREVQAYEPAFAHPELPAIMGARGAGKRPPGRKDPKGPGL